jgi:ComF family protein
VWKKFTATSSNSSRNTRNKYLIAYIESNEPLRMTQPLVRPLQSLLHLLFPHYCPGCFTDLHQPQQLICPICEYQLPTTDFASLKNNPVEKIFIGRLPLVAATSAFYFTSDSLIQELIFSLKYRQKIEAGIWLGRKLGSSLFNSRRFHSIDCIIPLPLHTDKMILRGYNQAEIIAKGIQQNLGIPLHTHAIIREKFTQSQTRQTRDNRWLNMKEIFRVTDTELLMNKHCLLVDDVVTTGATLEACGKALLSVPGCQISIATVAYTSLTG